MLLLLATIQHGAPSQLTWCLALKFWHKVCYCWRKEAGGNSCVFSTILKHIHSFLPATGHGNKGTVRYLASFIMPISLTPKSWLLWITEWKGKPPKCVGPAALTGFVQTFTKENAQEFHYVEEKLREINFATMSSTASVHMTPNREALWVILYAEKWAFALFPIQKLSLMSSDSLHTSLCLS